jgi:hypothetical protein
MTTDDLEAVLRRTGCTYRQLDYWCRRGWLHPAGGGGSGRQRIWPEAEIQAARTMRRLVEAGMTVTAAALVSRGQYQLAPGIRVQVATTRDPNPGDPEVAHA